MAAKKSEEYRKWLDGHALLGSETVGDIDTFSLWVDTVRQIYACARRKTALVTLFLVSKDSLDRLQLFSCLSQDYVATNTQH